MEANEFLTGYYNTYDEDARLGYRHGQVEIRTTVKYIGMKTILFDTYGVIIKENHGISKAFFPPRRRL